MKKRILFAAMLALLFACLFALTVGASTTVTDDETDELILGECVIANLDGVTIPSPTVGLEYSLDEEAMTAAISGRGSFAGGVLSIPSTVTYGGSTYTVTTINNNLFQKLTYDLYIPDSITFIGGGSQLGTFGNSTIGYIYIGSGLNGFERETFSGSKGFKKFVCKSKPTYIGMYAFNQNAAAAEFEGFELDLTRVERFEESAFAGASFLSKGEIAFGDCVNFIGSSAFLNTRVNGAIVIPADCTLNYRCFNGTSFELVCIKVPEGETRSLPQELFSGSDGNMTVVIDGNAVANANHVFSGNSMTVYMPTTAQIQELTSTAALRSGNERLANVVFYSCLDDRKYTSSKDGTLTDAGETLGKHVYTTTPVLFPADCSRYERYAYVCYCCGNEDVVSQGSEYGNHDFRVSIKLPTCQSFGYREYECRVCGCKESAHIAGQVNHNPSIESYQLKDSMTVIVTKRCEDCNGVVSVTEVSLVGKCYIEGYGLFDASLDYVSVNAEGVATPKSDATFDNAVIYFPSFVMVDGSAVEVKTVQGFKAKSIASIYIPDTVTRIAGGSGKGCFGDISTLKNIVVGKGVTAIEQEVFCIGNGAKLDEFIFKGVITRLESFALKSVSASSSSISHEFNTNLSYVGKQVNLDGNIIREAKLAKGCDLSQKFAFNNANGLVTVYIEGGDTPETALDLGQEFTSNLCTKNLYIKGYVTVSGQAVLSGQSGTRIYMSSIDAIDYFATAIKSQGYRDRINSATFMDCETGTAWYINSNQDRVEHPNVSFSHGGVVTVVEATCTEKGSTTESCFVCGEVTSVFEIDAFPHSVDGGVITVMPTQGAKGVIVYTCTTCGEAEEREIYALSTYHEDNVVVTYPNGYTENGTLSTKCTMCDFCQDDEVDALVEILGFSVKEDMTSITYGYKLNIDVLTSYEGYMGALDIGFIVANASDVESIGLLDKDYNMLDGVRGFKIAIVGRQYCYIEIKVVGMATDALRSADFLLTLYVVGDSDGDGNRDLSFVQQSLENVDNKPITAGDYVLNTISLNRAYSELNN